MNWNIGRTLEENNPVSVGRPSFFSRHVMNSEHKFTFEDKQKTKLERKSEVCMDA